MHSMLLSGGWTDNLSKDWGFIKAKSAPYTHTHTRTGMHQEYPHGNTQSHQNMDLPGRQTDTREKIRTLSQTNLLLSGS